MAAGGPHGLTRPHTVQGRAGSRALPPAGGASSGRRGAIRVRRDAGNAAVRGPALLSWLPPRPAAGLRGLPLAADRIYNWQAWMCHQALVMWIARKGEQPGWLLKS